MGELFELVPGVKDRFSDELPDELLDELKEEIAWREDPKYAHATIRLIESIQNEWRNTE